jgi:hypothetical protein
LSRADPVAKPYGRYLREGDGRCRRIADETEGVLGRLNWADSGRWPNGSKLADRRQSHATPKAPTPPEAVIGLTMRGGDGEGPTLCP